MHSEAAHRVWAPWNHPTTTALSKYLIGSKMLEDDTAYRKAMLDVLPALVSTIRCLFCPPIDPVIASLAIPPCGLHDTARAVAT
jgi:hypothetical protein